VADVAGEIRQIPQKMAAQTQQILIHPQYSTPLIRQLHIMVMAVKAHLRRVLGYMGIHLSVSFGVVALKAQIVTGLVSSL